MNTLDKSSISHIIKRDAGKIDEAFFTLLPWFDRNSSDERDSASESQADIVSVLIGLSKRRLSLG